MSTLIVIEDTKRFLERRVKVDSTETSDSMTFEIAQTAELSFAVATDLPVEIKDWVSDRLELIDLSV
jgi:hypothetical protein